MFSYICINNSLWTPTLTPSSFLDEKNVHLCTLLYELIPLCTPALTPSGFLVVWFLKRGLKALQF